MITISYWALAVFRVKRRMKNENYSFLSFKRKQWFCKLRSLFVMTDANQTITDIKFYPVCGGRI